MPVVFADLTVDQHRTVSKIAKRAVQMNPFIDFMAMQMDITAVYNSIPLKLDEWLAAPDGDFIHDAVGIRQNLNRETGELENCFLPRYVR